LNLQYRDFDLSPLLESTIDLYRGQFEQKRIDCSLTFPEGPVKVHADPDRVKQCVVNLLQNAAEASDVGGQIEICARPSDGQVELTIRDAGVGLPPEAETRLFDLFFTTKETGTGLGLSTVKKIVNAHGGQISLKPAHPGTEVRLTLPLSQI
jgi:signal transduction histidine kinase